jgi:hypothetical protein
VATLVFGVILCGRTCTHEPFVLSYCLHLQRVSPKFWYRLSTNPLVVTTQKINICQFFKITSTATKQNSEIVSARIQVVCQPHRTACRFVRDRKMSNFYGIRRYEVLLEWLFQETGNSIKAPTACERISCETSPEAERNVTNRELLLARNRHRLRRSHLIPTCLHHRLGCLL